MERPLSIWRLCDGKPGHENQSLGLVRALARRVACEWHDVCGESLPSEKPDLILGAGHRTHLRLWRLKRRYRAFGVVLMKPSLPLACFDLCLVPRHDLKGKAPSKKVVVTEGVLNLVEAVERDAPSGRGLILVGGPSKEFDWDGQALMGNLKALVEKEALHWSLTNSRRTPESFNSQLEGLELEVFPHQETSREWLPDQLNQAQQVWVSEDSVSMLYEALSSGAEVGLLPMPLKGRRGRVAQGVRQLVEAGRVLDFAAWQAGERWQASQEPLREADRCAEIVLERWREFSRLGR